jgi:hypothetical protein
MPISSYAEERTESLTLDYYKTSYNPSKLPKSKNDVNYYTSELQEPYRDFFIRSLMTQVIRRLGRSRRRSARQEQERVTFPRFSRPPRSKRLILRYGKIAVDSNFRIRLRFNPVQELGLSDPKERSPPVSTDFVLFSSLRTKFKINVRSSKPWDKEKLFSSVSFKFSKLFIVKGLNLKLTGRFRYKRRTKDSLLTINIRIF